MHFLRWLNEEVEDEQNNATVYHLTSEQGLVGIKQSGRMNKTRGGDWGDGVYTFLDLPAAVHVGQHGRHGDYLVAAKVSLHGFLSTVPGVSEQLYGTRSYQDQIDYFYGDAPASLNRLGMDRQEAHTYWSRHAPGVIVPARGNERYSWVVVYDAERLKPVKYAKHPQLTGGNIQWLDLNWRGD